jgi:hypothetical protein
MRSVNVFCLALGVAGELLCATAMRAQTQASGPDQKRAAVFDRLDRTSRMLIESVRCARNTARAREDGLLGPLDSLGRRGRCLQKNGRAFGVFFTPDTAFTKALRLRVLDNGKGTRDLSPVDTIAILTEARAAEAALIKGYPSFQREWRQFAPFSIRSDGDTIEVWLLPIGLLTGWSPSAVGGERGFIYSPDGRTLVREIDSFDRYRTIQIPDAGRVEIPSREEDLPLVSELFATNLLHDRGREVQLITGTFTAQIVGPSSAPMWMQIRRR